jgi:high frequency lysogenization protein
VSALAERCTALAALVQGVVLVDAIAFGRPVEVRRSRLLIDSIFATDPDDVDAIFTDPRDLDLGRESAAAMLGRSRPELVAAMRYAFVVIDIERRLRRRDDVVAALGRGIRALADEREALDEETLHRRLSELYLATISTLERRIQIAGLPEVLKRDAVAAQVRSLLLAAIRAAWLWRQLGGRRWQLLLERSTIRRELLSRLASPSNSSPGP